MVGVGPGGVTAWQNCDESRRFGGRAADQANEVGRADAGVRQTSRRNDRPRGVVSYLASHAGRRRRAWQQPDPGRSPTITVPLFAPDSARPADNHSVIIEFLVDDVDGVHRNLTGFVEDFVTEPTTMPDRKSVV